MPEINVEAINQHLAAISRQISAGQSGCARWQAHRAVPAPTR